MAADRVDLLQMESSGFQEVFVLLCSLAAAEAVRRDIGCQTDRQSETVQSGAAWKQDK
jgi:hypothetical protein